VRRGIEYCTMLPRRLQAVQKPRGGDSALASRAQLRRNGVRTRAWNVLLGRLGLGDAPGGAPARRPAARGSGSGGDEGGGARQQQAGARAAPQEDLINPANPRYKAWWAAGWSIWMGRARVWDCSRVMCVGGACVCVCVRAFAFACACACMWCYVAVVHVCVHVCLCVSCVLCVRARKRARASVRAGRCSGKHGSEQQSGSRLAAARRARGSAGRRPPGSGPSAQPRAPGPAARLAPGAAC
jgi:hypothetical protein